MLQIRYRMDRVGNLSISDPIGISRLCLLGGPFSQADLSRSGGQGNLPAKLCSGQIFFEKFTDASCESPNPPLSFRLPGRRHGEHVSRSSCN